MTRAKPAPSKVEGTQRSPSLSRLFAPGAIFLLVLSLGSLAVALDVPPLRGRINDLAGMITADAAKRLEEGLRGFENETGHQIAVLTIPSLEGEDLEGFSIRVAETWKIGQKGFDNGAILLIARDDRKLRIEVGYGLEGVLPDAIASRIINEVIVPRFRANDYSGGIEAGVNALMRVTKGEVLPEKTRPTGGRGQVPSLATAVIVTAILGLFIGMTQRRVIGGAIGGAAAGLATAAATSLGLGLGLFLTLIIGAFLGVLGSTLSVASSGSQWTAGSRYRKGGLGRRCLSRELWGRRIWRRGLRRRRV